MAEKKKYDSTVARIAGNIAAGLIRLEPPRDGSSRRYWEPETLAKRAVEYARFIVAEVERTEPGAASSRPEDR